MKVLEVLDTFYPNVDGPISVMVSLAKKFNENGLGEVELLVPSYPVKVDVEGVKIHRCKSMKANENYRAALPFLDTKIKKVIKEGGYDIIHMHSPFTLAHFALKQGKKLKIPVVFTFHTKFKDEFKNRLKSGALVKFMMNYVMNCINGSDCITTVSRGSIETLKEYGCIKCGEVKVIYNGTDMPPMAADREVVAKIRKELGLDGNFAFMFAGRLAEVKNIQFSIKALSLVKARGVNNFKFVIIGDGDYGKTLKALVEENNLTENVIFAGKISDRKQLAAYFTACDAMLFPSMFDTASITIPEAAANGLPAVMIAGSSSAERLADGVNGFLWENDAEVWADNIIKLIENPALAKTAGEGALKEIYASWDEIAESYCRLYKELIEEKND